MTGDHSPVIVLIPDLDGELEFVLSRLEEALLSITAYDDCDDEEWAAPAGFDHNPADAVADIAQAVRAAVARTGRVLAPDGRFEYNPVRVVELDRSVIERVGAAIRALGHLVAQGSAVAAGAIETTTDIVEQAARLHGLLDYPADTDNSTVVLAAQLADGVSDVVLDPVGETAYRAVVARIMAMWHANDPFARFLYLGVDPGR